MPFVRLSLKCLKKKAFDFEPGPLGDQIRRRRLECGLTQRQAGEHLGVSGWTVANWEKGHTSPTDHAHRAVLAFLGHDPSTPDA